MKKTFALWIAAVLLVATALTGCGGNSNSSGGEQSTAPANSATESVEPAKNVTLKVMGLEPNQSENVKALFSGYEAEHPGVKVAFEIMPSGQGSTLLKTRFASGDAPDIFYLFAGELPAWSDKLADLSNEPWMAHVLPEGLRNVTVDGKKVGFPWKMEGHAFVYNKDLFAKAGITEVPTTQMELKQAAEKLKAAGIQPFGEAYKDWGFIWHLLGVAFAYENDQAGFIDGLNKGTKQIKDMANLDNFFKVLDMTTDYGFGKDSIGYDFNQQIADFANGKMAMIKQGTWVNDLVLKQNPNLNIGMFAAPLTDDASQSKFLVAATGNWVINKDSKNLEESKAFLNWLHENGQKYMVEQFKIMPVFDDLNGGALGPLFEDMQTYIKEGKTYDNFGIERWPTGFIEDIAKPLQAYIAGVATKEEAVEELQALWEQRLKK